LFASPKSSPKERLEYEIKRANHHHPFSLSPKYKSDWAGAGHILRFAFYIFPYYLFSSRSGTASSLPVKCCGGLLLWFYPILRCLNLTWAGFGNVGSKVGLASKTMVYRMAAASYCSLRQANISSMVRSTPEVEYMLWYALRFYIRTGNKHRRAVRVHMVRGRFCASSSKIRYYGLFPDELFERCSINCP